MISESSSTSRWIGARSASTMRRRSAAVRACSASDVSTATVRAPRCTAISSPAETRSPSGSSSSSANRRNAVSGSWCPSAADNRANRRSDDRRGRGNGRSDRTDRLVAGEENVAEVLDPRGEGIGAFDVVGASGVASLECGDPVPGGRCDHDRGDHPTGHGEHDDSEPGRPRRTNGEGAVESNGRGRRRLGVGIVDRDDQRSRRPGPAAPSTG